MDTKDRRILSTLDLAARSPYQHIAKQVGLSKETVIYRIHRLEKQGIIQRYTTLVNFGKLNYTGFAVFNRFANADDTLKHQIISELSKNSHVYWIALTGGKFDLVFGVMCISVFSFNRLYYEFLNKHGKHLVDNTIQIRTELRQNKRNYLTKKKQPPVTPPYFGKEPELEYLDDLDSSILSLLSNHARISVVDLARYLATPASTIALRIKTMEQRGIIQGYTTYIKAQYYGMQSYRLLLTLTNMDATVRTNLFSYVYENEAMILAIETVGQWHFEITLEVNSHQQLQHEISLLRNQFKNHINNLEFLIMFEDDLVYDPYPLKKQTRPTDLPSI